MTNYDLNMFNSTYVTNYGDLTIQVNNASGGVFSALFLAVVFVFLLIAFKDAVDSGIQNFITSSFITFIVAILMFLGGMIVWEIAFIPFVVFIASGMIYFYQR